MIISPWQIYNLEVHGHSTEKENFEISKRCDSLFFYAYDWLRNNRIICIDTIHLLVWTSMLLRVYGLERICMCIKNKCKPLLYYVNLFLADKSNSKW